MFYEWVSMLAHECWSNWDYPYSFEYSLNLLEPRNKRSSKTDSNHLTRFCQQVCYWRRRLQKKVIPQKDKVHQCDSIL